MARVSQAEGDGVADAAAPRTVLVTGAARGIGRAIADAFVREGDRVFGADIGFPAHAAVPATMCVAADVTDPASVDALFATIEASTEGVDVLVNNAGILRAGALASVTRGDWAAVMAVNLEAMYFLSQRAVSTLRRRRTGGAIVNIASTSAMVSSPGQSLYDISKAGVTALTRALAVELASEGIRVNAVAPGLIDTELTRTLFGSADRFDARVRANVPLGRAGSPEEVARVVVFLASESADYIVGQTVAADGGWLLA
jgi:NAD(P)-dependent dehydrogenase (short-subunit alcohol dehydrogenase family)